MRDSKPKEPNVLVIGAGVIGVCSAYYLARRGVSVTVIDKDEIGSPRSCSYGNGGLICPSHTIPLPAPGVLAKGLKWMLDSSSPLYIKPRPSRELISWLWRFARACWKKPMRRSIPLLRDLTYASRSLFEELAALDELDCGYAAKGVLALFRTDHGLAVGVKDAQMLESFGIASRTLDTVGVREMEPCVSPDLAGGIHYPDDAQVNPAVFTKGLARIAASMGAVFKTSTEVLGFSASDRRIDAVDTTRGTFLPEQVVLAAGSWSTELGRQLGLKLLIQPAKGYTVDFRRSGNGPSTPILLPEVKAGLIPMAESLRFGGTLELAGFDLSINRRRVDAIMRTVTGYLCDPEPMELIEIWRGLRPATPDGLPTIGRTVAWKNLVLATGHGMLGVSLGPITGKLVSQVVSSERPDIDLGGLCPERFL